jgi:enoyl-CoA hydratase/carnithine racemase
MSDPVVKVKKEGHLTIITICRADRLNALDAKASAALGETFTEFENDQDQWVAILTGEGRAFCTGNDLVAMSQGGGGAGRAHRPGSHGPGFASICKRFPLYKPVIAAINGYAVAGGLELALVCDILVAGESAKFGLTEVKWGLMPMGGGTQRLPRSVPRAWANYLMLTGDQIGAEDAQKIGLISHVVPDDELLAKAREIADMILSRGPLAVWAAKEVSIRGADLPLDQALAYEDAVGSQVLQSEDSREGPRAFAEKRPPDFQAK